MRYQNLMILICRTPYPNYVYKFMYLLVSIHSLDNLMICSS